MQSFKEYNVAKGRSLRYLLSRCTQTRSSKATSNGAATMAWNGAHCPKKCSINDKKGVQTELEEEKQDFSKWSRDII